MQFLPRPYQLATRRERRLLLISARRRFSDRASFHRAGVRWTVPSWDEFVAWSICADGTYDADHRNALLGAMHSWGRIAPGRDLVVEIGANFGSHTVPFALAGLRVLAVEPVPFLFELLNENVRQNGLAYSVRSERAAISRAPGKGRVLIPAANGGGGELVLDGRSPTFASRFQTLSAIEATLELLDVVLQRHAVSPGEVAFVWCDAQGCEADVIASGRSLWGAGVPLYAELWPRGLEQQASVAEFLALAGRHFCSFIEAEALTAGRLERRPLGELADLIESSGWHSDPDWSTDVVLLS
jgi:FkbM family methyltransferase